SWPSRPVLYKIVPHLSCKHPISFCLEYIELPLIFSPDPHLLQKKNAAAALANGHAKPNGYCKSINAHDDLAMPQPAEALASATPVSKANGSSSPLSNGHGNGLANGYKQLSNGNGSISMATANGSTHKGANGGLLTNGYATKLLDDASQELKQRKTPK
uniref:Uncharacterized protein LOC108047609 n=1 Tax=Drosophila rhopaloa TaxID=1041015 RepID=A0A6P4EZ00_DRORH